MVAKAHETIAWLPMTDTIRARTNVGQNKVPTSQRESSTYFWNAKFNKETHNFFQRIFTYLESN
jgi:hypothetical protein